MMRGMATWCGTSAHSMPVITFNLNTAAHHFDEWQLHRVINWKFAGAPLSCRVPKILDQDSAAHLHTYIPTPFRFCHCMGHTGANQCYCYYRADLSVSQDEPNNQVALCAVRRGNGLKWMNETVRWWPLYIGGHGILCDTRSNWCKWQWATTNDQAKCATLSVIFGSLSN